jgi:shikimate dehydrogenase
VVGAAGGAGAAIVDALCAGGPAEIFLVDPATERLASLAKRLAAGFPDVEIICGAPTGARVDLAVNASPVGMRPDDALPIDLDRVAPGAPVCDVITKPAMTPLLVEAARRGHPVQTGNEMADVQIAFQMRHLGLWRDETKEEAK